MSGQDFSSMRALMVSNQLRPNAVIDLHVLDAMGAVARERFVNDSQLGVAHADYILPLAKGRGLNPPLATAKLLEAAEIRRGQRVLVVGAGTGYVPALLAHMGARIVALEEDARLLSRMRLALANTPEVEIVGGPLTAGWPAGAPYDVVYVDGVIEQLPDALVDQVAEQGVLVGGLLDHGISRAVEGRRAAGGFNTTSVADIAMAPLPGFAPAPAFAF